MNATVLIIDDEQEFRDLLAKLLQLEGYQVFQAATGKEGLAVLDTEDVLVMIIDVRLPDISGLDLLPIIQTKHPLTEIIMLTAYGTIADGVQAMKQGAFDYLTKGDEDEKIVPLVQRALEKAQIRYRLDQLEQRTSETYRFDAILGQAPAILQAIEMARKVAETDTPVLLLGETGTGKEIFAQAIHYASRRRTHPFVAINCSAFAKDLLESEMFGYKAGAFTGASKAKKGLFEEAHQGTLFLDEIGELDPSLQAKFLRAIETNTFIKPGDTKPTQVDVRIIAATNRNLQVEIAQGNFRADLFYRINVMNIELPPLRQHKTDLPLLTEYFVQWYARKMNRAIPTIMPDFLQALQQYDFPGNIRELRNVIERAIILCDDQHLTAAVLPKEIVQPLPNSDQSNSSASLLLEEVEKRHILAVLEQTQGNKTQAAELLGISLTTLYRKLQSYGID